jgi:hypothetical protein
LPTIRRYNRHGALVVRSPTADFITGFFEILQLLILSRKPDSKIKIEPDKLLASKPLHEVAPIEDLDEDKPPGNVPLNIEDQHLYFEARSQTEEGTAIDTVLLLLSSLT